MSRNTTRYITMKMKNFEINQEVDNLQAVLATRFIGHKERTTHAVAKALLLRGFYFYNGQGCLPFAKSIGCGVYEVFLKKE